MADEPKARVTEALRADSGAAALLRNVEDALVNALQELMR
jgi:hypothetical protein